MSATCDARALYVFDQVLMIYSPAPPITEVRCSTSGGTWTDDDSDYCVCTDGTEAWDGGACE